MSPVRRHHVQLISYLGFGTTGCCCFVQWLVDCMVYNRIQVNLLVFVLSPTVLPESRVVGGTNARAGELLFSASLQTVQAGHFCGGAIISDRWIVTAASCVVFHWPGSFTVRTGTHTHGQGGVSHATSALTLHEQFDYNYRYNDIALVKTATTIAINAQTTYGIISSYTGHTTGTVSGWGYLSEFGPRATYLQYFQTNIITNEQCKTALAYNNYSSMVLLTNVCALSTWGQGMCRGDSGSPLTNGNELVGIASFGVSCATGVPDVYTRLSSYITWINTVKANNPY